MQRKLFDPVKETVMSDEKEMDVLVADGFVRQGIREGEVVIRENGPPRQFGNGAQRDNATGKGRMDLMPWDAVLAVTSDESECSSEIDAAITSGWKFLGAPTDVALTVWVECTLTWLDDLEYDDQDMSIPGYDSVMRGYPLALLAISRIYEAGAVKYNERNWELGIPTSVLFDSAMRHLQKAAAGYVDEPHPAMAGWNALCLLATRLRVGAQLLPEKLDDMPGRPGFKGIVPGMRPAESKEEEKPKKMDESLAEDPFFPNGM